jgi:hypothetical protein
VELEEGVKRTANEARALMLCRSVEMAARMAGVVLKRSKVLLADAEMAVGR